MSAPKVLISDKLDPQAAEIFKKNGVEVDVIPGLSKEELFDIIDKYDGLAIRSATKATEKIINQAKNLKVIGRAGIGVDNVDIPAASAKGIIVMNTPFGNSITTAEHAITMLLALARQIPLASASTHNGKWEKSRFMGVEVTGKTLGIIGCGNIGGIVADRALGLKMKVIAFDPFLTDDRAVELGIEKVDLDELLSRIDFLSLHTPLTDKTRNIIDATALNKMKKGVRIVNCARGGLIDEVALKAALEAGHVAGAALDVYAIEPAKENDLFGMENVICTPHLGASTTEAQVNVALQVAEQMSDYLINGAVTNALNSPSVTAEEAPRLKPFIKLAESLGSFAGQLTENAIKGIRLEYEGDVADMNIKALTSAAVTGVLRPLMQDINMVSAPIIAEKRGVVIEEVTRSQQGVYDNYIRLTIETDVQTRSVAGTIFSDGKLRLIQVKGVNMDAELTDNMLYVINKDKSGFIGALGSVLGENSVNIASFNLGRVEEGGEAISLIAVDAYVNEDVIGQIADIEQVTQVKSLQF